MTQSGFTIVFGGPDFHPDEFLRDTRLAPTVIHRGDMLRDGRIAQESWLEFTDIRSGTYPLDAATEALDLLSAHREEFIRLSHFPGVATRSLNFFGDAESCYMELDEEMIALLHALSLHVSISPA